MNKKFRMIMAALAAWLFLFCFHVAAVAQTVAQTENFNDNITSPQTLPRTAYSRVFAMNDSGFLVR